MKKGKIHFAEVEKANESQNFDEWAMTLCGLQYGEHIVTDKIQEVTCKKCLKAFPKYDAQMKHISEHWGDYF
jgi:hypothetical protein